MSVPTDLISSLIAEGTAIPGLAALAIGADGPARLEAPANASREPRTFAIRRDLVVAIPCIGRARGCRDIPLWVGRAPRRRRLER